MSDVFLQVEQTLGVNRIDRIIAAPARRISAADLANDLLAACTLHGVEINDVLDLIHIGVSGRAYTAFDRTAPTQQTCRYDASSADQQSLPEHDQSAFK